MPGDDHDQPESEPNQASHGDSDFADNSGPIFSMYLKIAEEEDKRMAESWKSDAEGILIFTGLFSSVLASLISVSIQEIQQNPQDTSNFYLANIYQAMADPNRTTSLPTYPPPFSPPSYAVWVNGLWFMSLVISITCAVLATLLQQWARRYLKLTQTRYSLQKRARIRSFFAEGVQKSFLPLAVEALPTLLHVSLVLFFAGLLVFLWNVNLTIFGVVLSWIGACTALYGCTMLASLTRCGSPYYTPLTPLVVYIAYVTAALCAVPSLYMIGLANMLYFLFYLLFHNRVPRPFVIKLFSWAESLLRFVLASIYLGREEVALLSPPEIDTRALMWTFGRLDEDHELERFFSGLSSFRSFKVVKKPVPRSLGIRDLYRQTRSFFYNFHSFEVVTEPLRDLSSLNKLHLVTRMIDLLDRTFSSDLLPDRVKCSRTDICTDAVDLLDTPEIFSKVLSRLASESNGPVQSTETVRFLKRWGSHKGEDMTPVIQAMFSIVVARVQQHDDSWFTLASEELGISEAVLRSHATHRNNLSFTILMHATRQQFTHFRNSSWPYEGVSDVLEAASKCDVQDTSQELQHEFCALWNQMLREAQYDSEIGLVLRPLLHVYTSIHQHTAPSLTQLPVCETIEDHLIDHLTPYPLCNVPDHILDESLSTTFPRTILRNDAALAPSLTSPDLPSSSVPAPLHVDECPTTLPPLGHSHHTHHTVENFCAPFTSPDPATAGAILQEIVASDITSPYPTPETTSPPPLSYTSLPATIPLQYNVDPLTPSDLPNSPSSASRPVLVDISATEPHRSVMVTTASSAPPVTTTGPAPGTVGEDDGNPKPGYHKDNDVPDPHSLDHALDANLAATPDLQSQESASLPPVTHSDFSIAGRSLQESNAEHTADRPPPDPSRYQYDIV